MNTRDSDKLFSVTEAADYFQVAVSTMYRWLDKGILEAVQTPLRKTRIRKSDLDDLRDELRELGGPGGNR
ncbi:hypothetical protein CVCC1112_723 [Paenarthrobacter nicotinovorans]|uniref:helix-turn-helix domain-containing protein n=1 Tax=Paenarthrobacter nicotinovorans TaxID=29320 RepID=UPI0007CCC609|nr:helix-turn-helix domain-containing protein [Paenarthrobacter nicotinovorans]GAT86063.1 hypothetical protein CVCC1112_723 [Paenarthrobacter nicotinovorans]